jgi:hypothetical protein
MINLPAVKQQQNGSFLECPRLKFIFFSPKLEENN